MMTQTAHPAICGACHRDNPIPMDDDLPSGKYVYHCQHCGAKIEVGVLNTFDMETKP